AARTHQASRRLRDQRLRRRRSGRALAGAGQEQRALRRHAIPGQRLRGALRRRESHAGHHARLGPEYAERRGAARRRALRRRSEPHPALRRYRSAARRAAQTRSRHRPLSPRNAPRLEVHSVRPGRPALRPRRRAVQRLRSGSRALRAHLPDPGRRLGLRGVRARRSKLGGIRLGPRTKELWFTDNGRDMLGDDLPSDELNHAPKPEMHFGYPYCHQGDIPDPEFGRKRSCSEFSPPAVKLGPHVAALGMRFYTGNQFPAEYRNNIFIAEHGSWNRSKKIGYRVARVVVEGSRVLKHEVFAEGWSQGGAV